MSPRRSIFLLSVTLFVTLFGAFAPLQAQDADIIRGQVVGADKKPLENITVTATSLVNQTSRTAKTNKDGRFSIIFNGGGGDYMMAYTGIGFQPARFEVKREVDEDILIADATVGKAAVVLDAVRVNAGRERPGRDGNQLDVGGRDQVLNNNNVPIDVLGDLSAMAATLPGVTLIPGADGAANGISVLGLGADQNNITLNGLNFSGTDLPRDATTQTRVTTSSFDPSRGGFSGAQIALRTSSGSNYKVQSIHQSVDAPSLQYTDAIGRQLGQQFTNLQFSGNASGPFRLDKSFYSFSWQLGRRSNNLQDLLNTDPLALERVGVSQDSVARLLNMLQAEGIPLSTSAIPSQHLTENGSFLSSFDFAPSGGHNFNITLNGRWNGQDATSLQTTAVPVHGGQLRNYGGAIQGRHSSYFLDNFLDETSASLQESVATGDPYIELPSATVRVNSDFPDGSAGVSSLQFGGSTSLPRNSVTTNGELQNQLSWISVDNKHRYKFGVDFRYNRYSQDNTTNRFGTYVYNSLADFQNDLPFSFTRRLEVNRRLGDDLGASTWLGAAYRPAQRFQLTYGVRVDASHFQGNPAFNPLVDSIFGRRNDAVPRGIYASPRLGFSWTYGTNPQIGGFQGAFRGSRGQLSGGVGEFQNLPSSQLIAAAVDQTGLPSAAQQLTCIGSAVPVPDWADYLASTGSIPSTCADNTTTLTSNAQNVSLFAPDYIPQRSWRANLNWNAPILDNRFRLSTSGTYSLNLNQQSQIDLNFAQRPVFTLASEGNRPVYVNQTSIFPSTGAIIATNSRLAPQFAQVTDYLSDLKSHSTQATIGISPIAFNSSFQWGVTYVWQKVTEETRGFSGGSTAGDPYDIQWSRGARDARHQITYNVGYTFHQAVSVIALGRVQSGNPFTPSLSADINGDGYNNDRAFIYDPAKTADPTLAAAMQNLLTRAPSSVRSCLERQLNTVAGQNSCEGPWYTQLSLRVSLVSQALKLPDRATISLGIANPLTGIDALVHGSNNLHGWGAPSFTDPTLLFVRGFNPATNSYEYDVNPRFGASRQGSALNLAPMQLTLDVRVDVGPERERQDLFLRLRSGRSGRGNKLNESQIKQQYERTYPNPFEQMLRQQDSLGLSNDVADSIAILNKVYGKVIDSIWTPVAKYLAALPDSYDLGEAYDRVRAAENRSLDQMAIYGPSAKKLLTDEQIRKLPPFIALFLDNQAIRQVRPGRAGGGRGGFFGS
ncbi:MAG: carboxypeptidase regulatory-like domain-containing protein [Gemmatimonadales bacterium]